MLKLLPVPPPDAAPVLLDDAVAIDSLHKIVPLQISFCVVGGPVPYPEIELTIF